MKRILILFLLLPMLVHAQSTGIQFETGLSWKQIQAKAKAENKYIFMDCFATWCGPCKWMSANIFPDKEAGDYMNAHFINVAVQMDKTATDNPFVKSWYADAVMLHDLYKVSAYPTYFVFAPDGTPLHCFTGSRENVKAFLAAVNEAFDPAKQYYGIMKQWKAHKSDTAYLFNAYVAAARLRNRPLADSIGLAYLNGQPDLLTTRNLQLINACSLIQSGNDKWFRLFLNNAAKIEILEKDSMVVANALAATVFKEEILPVFFDEKPLYWNVTKKNIKKKYPTIGQRLVINLEAKVKDHIHTQINTILRTTKDTTGIWGQVAKKMNTQYPDYDADLLITNIQIQYYADKNLWPESAEAAYHLMTKYGDKSTDELINLISWNCVFMHTNSPKVLLAAQKAMFNILKKTGARDIYMDTYANLIYKTGQKSEAINWENKAIETSMKNNGDSRDLADFKTNLAKMQQGQPTWEN